MTLCTSTSCAFGRICVPSIRVPSSTLLFVAEAPGYRELQELRPLVGPAGKLFDYVLGRAGITRAEVSIANSCGCVDMEREDRRPTPTELESCRPRLLDDIESVNPGCIVSMGAISQALFAPGMKVGQIRGKLRNWNGRPVVFTYHPARALPHRNPEVTPLIIEDIKLALEIAEATARLKAPVAIGASSLG